VAVSECARRIARLVANDNLIAGPASESIISVGKQFTAIVHRGEPEEGGFWAPCLAVPSANGQGESKEYLRSLTEAIQLLLESDREEAFRLDPKTATAQLLLV